MTRSRRLAAALAGGLLACCMTVLGLSAPAAAVTPTCTNIATPISAPVGCGGLYFPQLGTSGIQPNATSLTLTAASPQWNSHLTDTPFDASASSQDFTVYEVCDFTSGMSPVSPTEAAPCGTNGTPEVGPSGTPLFVAEITPLGQHLGSTVNSLSNLCISVEGVRNGPHHALRWRLVARTCNTLGAFFTPGQPDPPSGHGITGTVAHPNPWQTWAVVGPETAVPSDPPGFLFANDQLSGHFANRLYVLDVPQLSTVPGQWLLAYPENDQVNQIGRLVGCTGAVWQITPGHFDCP